MRILGLALVGVVALSAPIVAYADTPGAKMRPAGPVPGMPQLGGGSGSGKQPVLDGRGAGRHSMAVPPSQPREWARLHWAPNRYYSVWGPPAVWGAYTVWGAPYVPYRYYGDWGALWYPYAEWREPHGGWGNP